MIEPVINKLRKGVGKFVITDLDGSLFALGIGILRAPFLNSQSVKILNDQSIPLIVITGRPQWTARYDLLMRVIGIPKPDVVIIGLGTHILVRNKKGTLEEDQLWKERLTSLHWDIKEVLKKIRPVLSYNKYQIQMGDSNPHLLRVKTGPLEMSKVQKDKREMETFLGSKTSVYLAESRWKKNTDKQFDGYFMIVPSFIGKGNALKAVLAAISRAVEKPVEGVVIGDALVDVSMLSVHNSNSKMKLHAYLVCPTSAAKKELQGNTSVTITDSDGPSVILNFLKS